MSSAKIMTRMLTIVVLLFSLLPAHAEPEEIKRQEFPRGSPEDVVNALMKFDFNGGVRQNPDTYPQWFPLTTYGEPDASESAPYWACAVGSVIRSYKVLGKESIAPDKVRVLIEVEMVALIASARTLEKHINQCYWPELSTTIHNSTTGEVISLSHPQSAWEFIKLIAGKEMVERFFHDDYANSEEHLIPIATDIRIWQFKIDVVLKNGIWLISSALLPREHLGLKSAINYTKKQIEDSKSGIKVCAGQLKPPSVSYKKNNCPPVAFPEKELIHGSDKLNILNAIQGDQK